MNKLVIIGNGFDLAHGLKTRYSDFMLWYLKRSLEIAIKKGRHEDKLISLSTAHSKYRKTFQINHLKDFKPEINSVKYSLKESGFLKLLLENADDYNWVDIESEYYKSLVYWYNEIQLADKRVKKLHNIQLLSLNESLNCIKKNLIEYLNSLELEMVQKNQTISNHIDELMESIKKRNENAPFSESQICFLNFNYTSIIDTYLKKYNTSEYNFSVINIHGNLKDMDSIIFGYGDLIDSNYENLENAHNNEYLKHVKHFYYFQRQKFHELIRFIETKNNYGYHTKYDVHIMGHSCGVSDRMLLNRIFDPTTCTKIKIYYHQINKQENDFFEKTQNISRHLNKENKRNMEIIHNINECKSLT